MTEHVCRFEGKYKPNDFLGRLGYGLCECGETLNLAELCKRANATERLSAEDVLEYADAIKDRTILDKFFDAMDLRAYADILEGK